MEAYKTIYKPGVSEIKEKGSKFLGYAYGLDREKDVEKHMDEIRSTHSKATHHCYAYSWGIDTPKEVSKDDGEPSGTAGIPILGQIKSQDLRNVLVVSVRYYGGTKLGTGGLKKAYKSSAKTAIENAEFKLKEILVSLRLKTNYADNQKLLDILEKNKGRVAHQKIDMISEWEVTLPRKQEEIFMNEVEKYCIG